MSKFILTSCVAAISFLATTNPVFAEDNAGTEGFSVAGYKWTGRVNFGGVLTDGNANRSAVNLDGLARARDEKNRFTVGAELRFAEEDGNETENEYMAYGEYDRFISDKMFAGTRVSYEIDEIAELDRRIKVGPYVGYQYFESDPLNLSMRVGIDYIDEEFENGDTEQDIAATWGVDYDQKLIEDALQVFYKHDFSVPIDATDAFLFESEMGVRFPVAKILTGSAQIDFDWDNDPAEGVNENDTKYTLKLGYEF